MNKLQRRVRAAITLQGMAIGYNIICIIAFLTDPNNSSFWLGAIIVMSLLLIVFCLMEKVFSNVSESKNDTMNM